MGYAWRNVFIAFVTNFMSMGFAFYSFGVVLEAISRDFPEEGRFGASMVTLFIGLGLAISAPLVGKLIPTLSLRKLMTIGSLYGGIGYLLCAQAVEIWQICLLFGFIIAVSIQMMGGVAAQVLVVNWFEKNRPLALGISLLGLSASGVVMPHVATFFGETGGWRSVFTAYGWMLIAASPLIWLLVIDRPEQKGLGVDGKLLDKDFVRQVPPPISLKKIYCDPVLWTVAMPVGIAFMGSTAIFLHTFSFAKDLGLNDASAAWFISAAAAGAAGGKVFFSWLAQRQGTSKAFIISLIAQLVGFVCMATINHEWVIIVSVVAVGLGFGGIVPLLGAILAELYGRDKFATVLGAAFPLFTVFQGIGTPMAGYVYDQSQNYDPAFWFFAISVVIAIGLTLRIPKKHPNQALN